MEKSSVTVPLKQVKFDAKKGLLRAQKKKFDVAAQSHFSSALTALLRGERLCRSCHQGLSDPGARYHSGIDCSKTKTAKRVAPNVRRWARRRWAPTGSGMLPFLRGSEYHWEQRKSGSASNSGGKHRKQSAGHKGHRSRDEEMTFDLQTKSADSEEAEEALYEQLGVSAVGSLLTLSITPRKCLWRTFKQSCRQVCE